MVALSVSRVIRVSSRAITSPTLTATSITSTSLCPPISGTQMVLRAAGLATGAAAGAGLAGAAAATTGVAAALAAASTKTMQSPSLTLLPTLTLMAVITPATVLGTSMVALSVSRVMRVSSRATVSPTLTATSITSTSLCPPISGTLTSMTLLICCVSLSEAVLPPRRTVRGWHRGRVPKRGRQKRTNRLSQTPTGIGWVTKPARAVLMLSLP